MSDLAERVQRVRLLLDTLNDPYPTPRGALDPDSGPAPSRYVPCESCRGRGEQRVRGGWQLCLLCDGRGWKRREHEPEWDAYIELPLVEAIALPTSTAARRTPGADEDTFAWERARRTYDRHGSYRQLRIQLDWLSLTNARRFRLVRGVLVDHEPVELAAPMQLELDLGVVMIARRMPTVRVPPWLIERSAAAERRETIAELAASGMSAAAIARKLGVSKEAAKRKLKRNTVGSGVAGIPRRAM